MSIVSIQEVDITIATWGTSATQSITSVNTSNTMLIMAGCVSDAASGPHEFRRQMPDLVLDSATQISVSKAQSIGAATTFRVYVVEDDEYTVQRGEDATNYPDNITITAVTLAETIALVNVKGDAAGNNNCRYAPRLDLTSTTNLQITIDESVGMSNINKAWQVVECSRWTVQQVEGTATFGDINNETITSVDLDKTWWVGWGFELGSTQDIEAREQVTSELTSATNLRFERELNTSVNSLYTAYVIEDTKASVQTGNFTIQSTSSDSDTLGTAIVVANTFIATGAGCGLIYRGSKNDEAYLEDFCSCDISNTTTVVGTRFGTSSNLTVVPYSVVEFVDTASIIDEHDIERGIVRGIERQIQS